MYVPIDFFFVERALAGALGAPGAQILGPTWGPKGLWTKILCPYWGLFVAPGAKSLGPNWAFGAPGAQIP